MAGSNVTYNISATELFSVLPPLFLYPTNTDVFTNLPTYLFSLQSVATDLDNPPLPLSFALVSGPTNMTVSDSGLINWTATEAQGPTFNGPATNTILVSVSNGEYAVTNSFTIITMGTNLAPVFVTPNPPNQVVVVPGGTLVFTNAATNLNQPDYPLTYTLLNPPAGAAINNNGIITWTPASAQAGTNYLITTVVTDTDPWALNATSLSATNSFNVTVEPSISVGPPQTNTVAPGGINWLAVSVPTNAFAATNTLLFATNLPVNVWFSTNLPPTTTNPNDVDLLPNATNGTRVLSLDSTPALVPGSVYFLGVQNTNAVAVGYALQVNFLLMSATNSVPISSIVHTNIGGTNGYLLTWFAPSNDLFQVQWTSGLVPPTWNSFTNIVGYNTNAFTSPSHTQFDFFDDGSQTGGFGAQRFYRLIVLNSPASGSTVASGGINWLAVSVPTNAFAATNTLLFATNLPVNVWFSTNLPPTTTNPNDVDLLPNATNGTRVLSLDSTPALVPGSVYFLGVQNTNAVAVGYALQVNFLLVSATNSVPISSIVYTNIGGTNGYLLTWFAPSNDLFRVQWTDGLVRPTWNSFTNIVGYNTNAFTSPSHTQFNFFDDGSQTGGFSALRFYRLILLNGPASTSGLTLPAQSNLLTGVSTPLVVTNTATDSNPSAVLTYSLVNPPAGTAISTNGIITWTPSASATNSPATFTTIVTDNGTPSLSATNSFTVTVVPVPDFSDEAFTPNGYLLTWFAPSNELFQVEWRTNLLSGGWNTFTNIISYNASVFTSPAHTQFNFLDDGSQDGGLAMPHYYHLVLLTIPLVSVTPPPTIPTITSVVVTPSGASLKWSASTNEQFEVRWATNLISPIAWTTFPNVISSTSGAFVFTDTNAPLFMKFYELILLP